MAREIKNVMTHGVWASSHSHCVISNQEVVAYCDCEHRRYSECEANAAAIVLAVNNTFGAGYDPAKMLEFMQAFEAFAKTGIKAYPTTGPKLIQLFHEAKLSK